MRLLADYFPLVLFFVAFKWQGIWIATGVAIVASVAQIAWFHFRSKVSPVHWISFAIIVVFGGATLLLHDDTFIRWKPTVLYLAFGGILAAGKLFWRRDLLAVVMKDVQFPPPIWTRITWSWALFFAAMAFANWYVAFHFPIDTWVSYKVWGSIVLFLAFGLIQGLFLARHVIEPAERSP